ncbi:hypothetical protein L596_019799 [Steinernema carpocapsae]|uniref:G-protein coupled receptors family 1 profile domain-containing protein n=1 Tax=Steinernema carpocapsae TaxID=34508 RepID=A0A4U5MRP6_STECR|nr:hypothetical protein L596_019799 [Steinernema carpocapsae]
MQDNTTTYNFVYTVGVEIELILQLIQICLAIYFIVRLRNISLMHVNLRVILHPRRLPNHDPSAYLLYSGISDQLLSSHKMESSSFERCLVIRFFYDMALTVLAFTIPMIAVERTIATFSSGCYEKKTKPYLGFAIVTVMYCVGIVYSSVFVWHDYAHNSAAYAQMPSCHLMFTNPGVMFYLAVSCCIGFSCAIALLCFLYFYNVNKQKQYGCHKLGSRYQYAENVATLKVLVPTVTGYLASLIVSMTLIALHYFKSAYMVSSDWLYEQIFNINVVIFILYFVGMFLCLYAPLKKQFIKDLEKLFSLPRSQDGPSSSIVNADHTKTTDIYFKQLQSDWK